MESLCRKQGLAQRLMDILEEVTESVHRGYFVDLFVRASNAAAIAMYHKVGYQPAPSALFHSAKVITSQLHDHDFAGIWECYLQGVFNSCLHF